ncbi:MAG: GNAT family N-acetyltransferase [Candidatus Nealsonbacteria bacterium]|nr:GNAT family N-acetyltransferase [Candidatus Nealsonbacteria bacterium]
MKAIKIVRVDPHNGTQIKQVLRIEKDGFTGDDPPEKDPRVIRFLARNGWVFLLYVGGEPAGMIELLSLEELGAGLIASPDSPLDIVSANRNRLFGNALQPFPRRVVYHHGIAFLPEFRTGGYAKRLLRHALEAVADKTVICFIEAGRRSRGKKHWTINEESLQMHLRAGFRVTALVEPPVYDAETMYFACVRESA